VGFKDVRDDGLRLGWQFFPAHLVEPTPAGHQYRSLCTFGVSSTRPSRRSRAQEGLAKMRRTNSRTIRASDVMSAAMRPCPESSRGGSFYAFPNIRGTGRNASELDDGAVQGVASPRCQAAAFRAVARAPAAFYAKSVAKPPGGARRDHESIIVDISRPNCPNSATSVKTIWQHWHVLMGIH